MPFEDEFEQALRRTGDGFTAEQHSHLVEGGERYGRRRLVRRRAALVTGSVLSFAVVAGAGAYAAGMVGGGTDRTSVAAAPSVDTGSGTAGDKRPAGGAGKYSGEQLVAILKQLLPAGQLTDTQGRGTRESGPYAAGVFDDGKGKAAVSVSFNRFTPGSQVLADMTACPGRNDIEFDACEEEKLPGGSRLMVFQGYEYPDRREETKNWRAVLATKDGYVVDASEYNAAAEKDSPITRPKPPLTPAQLKSLVTSTKWTPVVRDLYAPPAAPGGDTAPALHVREPFLSLLPKGLRVVDKGGDGDATYAVVDDGKGRSLVQINVQPRMGAVEQELFPAGDSSVTQLADGTKVRLIKRPGEKGGEGVVWWTADTIRTDGLRVVVSAFNTGSQNKAATRAEPALTMEQLKAIALSGIWKEQG
ncbi:hypothetical protein [Streptomyces sp. NPDC093225]|uniref:hypothetical protein n=1 Tax=Streptomyces sp. NPDC093225 TaxID=3366034 RepID=UPI0038037FA2